MAVSIENLKRGDFVMLRANPANQLPSSEFGEMGVRVEIDMMPKGPIKIVKVEGLYAVIERNDEGRFVIYTPHWEIDKVSPTFARNMGFLPKPRKKGKAAKGKGQCQKCGAKLRKGLLPFGGPELAICPNCGPQEGPGMVIFSH